MKSRVIFLLDHYNLYIGTQTFNWFFKPTKGNYNKMIFQYNISIFFRKIGFIHIIKNDDDNFTVLMLPFPFPEPKNPNMLSILVYFNTTKI